LYDVKNGIKQQGDLERPRSTSRMVSWIIFFCNIL